MQFLEDMDGVVEHSCCRRTESLIANMATVFALVAAFTTGLARGMWLILADSQLSKSILERGHSLEDTKSSATTCGDEM